MMAAQALVGSCLQRLRLLVRNMALRALNVAVGRAHAMNLMGIDRRAVRVDEHRVLRSLREHFVGVVALRGQTGLVVNRCALEADTELAVGRELAMGAFQGLVLHMAVQAHEIRVLRIARQASLVVLRGRLQGMAGLAVRVLCKFELDLILRRRLARRDAVKRRAR